MDKEPVVVIMTGKIIPIYSFHEPFTTHQGGSDHKFWSDRIRGLIWYTDRSKTRRDIGSGVYGWSTRRKLSFNFGQYPTIL